MQTPDGIADGERWLSIRFEASTRRIAQVFDAFHKEGLNPILIKGWAIARCYPVPWKRTFSDIDVCVPVHQIKRAKHILMERVIGTAVDLHAGLRHLDVVPWEILYNRSTVLKLHGSPVRVLADEDHIRVLAAHWLNDGGVKRERLLDVYHCVSSKEDFDWWLALESLPPYRRTWVAKIVSACNLYAGVEISNHPFTQEELTLPEWFRSALEREWNSEPLYPLYYLLNQPRRFFKQLKRRFPPNPIQATIEMNAAIDESSRLWYQTSTFLRRIPRSILAGSINVSSGRRQGE